MELAKRFDDDRYKLYKEYMETASDQVVYKDGFFLFPQIKKKVKPPVLKNIFEEETELRGKRAVLLQKYKNIHDKMFFSQQNKSDYNSLVNKILQIDERLQLLSEFYETMNQPKTNTAVDKNESELKRRHSVLKSKQHIDKKSIKEYVSLIKERLVLLEGRAPQHVIDYYIAEMPEILDIDEHYVAPKKAKDKGPALKKDQALLIKDKIKELLARKFKFANKEECASAKRSQPYYTTKEDIIKTIETDDMLRSIMPKSYKSLNKEKICDHLFF